MPHLNGKTEKDIEKGDLDHREPHNVEPNNVGDNDDLSEYDALVRYISTYQPRGKAAEADEDEKPKKRGFLNFNRLLHKKQIGPDGSRFETPEEWLNTDLFQGLSSSNVETRRKKAGYNELSSEKKNELVKFLMFFTGPILYVMEVAAVLAAGLRDWIDFGVIVGILMLNAAVGWFQEWKAGDVVSKLKADISMKATVIRDGKESEILARELVPGDIIIIEDGCVVPAECRLICDYNDRNGYQKYMDEMRTRGDHSEKSDDGDEDEEEGEKHGSGLPILAIDQSAMTGESLAVDKFVADVVYYTTGCKRGKGFAVVTHSAKMSFVGRTASLVTGAQDTGHFKAIMDNIGTSLLVLVAGFILISWVGGFFHHLKIATPEHSSVNLLHYMLILLIVGVPVGLPVVTTTTLAVGAAYLANEKAVVQKLTAIESLAGVDVLCSDKTGTLTANQLSTREPFLAEGVDVNWMMCVAALASSHSIKSLDPIDKVTLTTLKRYPKAKEMLQSGWTTETFTPFDPVSKRITAVVKKDGVTYIAAKGAPKAILNLSNCSKEEADLYKAKTTEFARRGFRSLGVAVKEGDKDWQLLGLLSMFDPPREDTASTISEAQRLGLSVKMLTGDAIAIAKETCKMLALGTKVYNSDKLIHGGLDGTTQHDLVEKADGFAEVFPEHKYQVVEMLQQRGHLTAMTGDGVNDAPSLKKSDCGIAVEGATEAAQAAADIVFLAPGLSTIVTAIKMARQIFQRMKSYIQYRIALCLHLEIYLVTSMLIINETIRVELIVFLALFADLATIAVAYDNAHFEPRPVEWQLPKIWIISVILGALLAVGTWIIRGALFLPNGGIIENFGNVQGILFLEVSLTENWLIFVTRGGNTWPSWELVGAIFGVDVLATLFCVFGWLSGGAAIDSDPMTHNDLLSNTGNTSIVTIVIIWGYSILVTIVIAIVYFLLCKISWLDNLGRAKRSRHDTQMENIISHLSKVTIQHDKSEDSWHLATKAQEAEEDD
ncbi:hypothetical protein B7494_g7772 [Chlorociboria aeruginascens]|nr:hypothetical protein B7494_g7772 [Chlorociboria aeruginascens]